MNRQVGTVVVVFTLKTVPISTQYLLTFVLVQLTRTPSVVTGELPQRVHIVKNQKEIKGPRKVNTHAIIGKENKKPQKNKAPDSQTSQATRQTMEIDRAHRSHSTREAKQNKTNKKNQGSPIKTITSHDGCFCCCFYLTLYVVQ